MKRPKRTTIIFSDKDREYVEGLISQGREQSLTALISKIFDVYRSLAIHDWKYPGEYYVGPSRVSLFSQEALNAMLGFIPEKERLSVGRSVGEVMGLAITTNFKLEPQDRENWPEVLKHMSILGYGDFTLRENLIIIKNPFVTDTDLLAGILEGLIGKNIKVITALPAVFEVTDRPLR
ncbi:MAG: hypothetical protein ACE5PO_03685 [Candidatus Bathyarchaeia archaeon]